jgi:hypothetical protein
MVHERVAQVVQELEPNQSNEKCWLSMASYDDEQVIIITDTPTHCTD